MASSADFVSGWLAGCGVTLICHPFDTVKTRAQASHLSTMGALKAVVVEDPIRGFYRGVLSPMLGFGLARAMHIGVYGAMEAHFNRQQRELEESIRASERDRLLRAGLLRDKPLPAFGLDDDGEGGAPGWQAKVRRALGMADDVRQLPPAKVDPHDLHSTMQNQGGLPIVINAVCAATAGVAYASAMTPFEVVKVRMMTASLHDHRNYLSAGDCARQLYREGGVRKLYLGYGATIVRALPASVVYFGTYGVLRNVLPQARSANDDVVNALSAGGFPGALQWFVIFPLDSIKTKIQTFDCQRGRLLNDWATMARSLYKANGVLGFYNGLTPAIVNAFVRNGLFFAALESALKIFKPVPATIDP